jgi:TatD DNase family protein
MIDTHCHLMSGAFDADRDAVLKRSRAAGVSHIVVPSVGPGEWEPVLAFAAKTPDVHAALGVHPQLLPEVDPAADGQRLDVLTAMLARGGAVAVGECGLDGPAASRAPMERQLAVLRGHLALARRFRLPVLLHCLKAHDALLALLASEPPLEAGGVLHSFSGSAEQVRQYEPFGLHVSFAGPLTYAGARKPLAALAAVPQGRLVLETDAPDQTPRPHRGRCEPAHLAEITRTAAGALGMHVAELEALTDANARALFRLGA